MQYFNGVLVDYDAIQVEDDATRELLAYDPRRRPAARDHEHRRASNST